MCPVGSNWQQDLGHDSQAVGRFEFTGVHIQATAQAAADRGWYYRRARYLPLEPDTRRCLHCAKALFVALDLTQAERDIRHPLSTNVLLHEAPIAGEGYRG